MYFDWTYLVLVLPAFIFSMWASARVNGTFRNYQRQFSCRHISGSQAARMILDANGLQNVRIEQIPGSLTDHYDPSANVIRLSQSVYDNTSTAAIGVAAHEAGHAVQYATHYGPIRARNAILPIAGVGSRLAVPLIIIGLILGYMGSFFIVLAYVGIFFFAACTLFQLVTLPTEFNASSRALQAIQSSGILNLEEMEGAKRVLWAAAMTYVAALAVSLTQLLRFFMLVDRRN